MDAVLLISELAENARIAARTLVAATPQERVAALEAIAAEIQASESEILSANQEDLDRADAAGMASSLRDRLLLNQARVSGIANGAREVSQLPNPIGKTVRESTLPNGLHLKQITVPFGVVGMVYEARPNVTVDAAVILVMSGNAALLRGSSSAASSNKVLVDVMRRALSRTKISPDVVQLVPSEDRSTVQALLHARGQVDLVIPRGSAQLIRTVVDEATVPTIETGAGVCHVYIDDEADLEKALPILLNSKTQRPSVCNAAETLLVHQSVATKFLPIALAALHEAGVLIHGDEATLNISKRLGIPANSATEDNWSTEYGSLEMNVAVVPSLIAAADHIHKYGTSHTEAIVTESTDHADAFIALSDCAAVMINASTRFTDGEQMGFGAEIGISNQKLHARGPMGLEAMTTTTWIVTGTGQIRA
ncbi:MAG: glutamate-5-semialdehyde dehydrogenase [Actinomycetes bacterium]|jgi:glutamate-5-semialdehyde dehydrogenase